jgi:sugar lactone lactonase YvrE
MRFLRATRAAASVALPCRVLCAVTLLLAAAACGDGGTGAGNPTPAITHLDPVKVLQYTDSVRVTVTGSSFVQGAVVRLNGNARLTTYVSPSQLTAVVPTELMQQAGTVQVSVFNPEPRGGASNAMALPVEHRVPDILFLEPAGVEQGSETFVLEVMGAGFTQGTVVRWNGADRPTAFVTPGNVRAQIPASDVAATGTAQITVFNPAPGGGQSGARAFTTVVRPNAVPQLTGLSPATVLVETGATFTVTGTGFMASSQVSVGGFTPTTTFVSPTELRFTLQGSNLPAAGLAQVTVTNPPPGGGFSNPLHLVVQNPVPVLTALSPAQAVFGQDSLVVRITGTGFVAGGPFFAPPTEVQVNGAIRAARRISATELEVVLGAQEVAAVGTLSFRAWNGQPGGGTSNTLTLAIVNPAPAIGALTPAQAPVGGDSLVVRVSGTGFLPATQARYEGDGRPTRYVSATALDVVLGAADVDEPGTFAITVANPAPGGGTSAAASLTLTMPAPAITLLPSEGASAGRPGFPLVVHGTGFLPTSVVRWNGAARATRFISGTRLEVNVTDADVAAPGTAAITVHTPGGGTSAARQVTIHAVPSADITSTRTVAVTISDMVYAPAHDRIYASIPADAGARQNTVVAIDPHTGEITGSVLVGSDPDRLALSDDGSTLWVSLRATGQVRRLSLPGLTPGTVFSLGTRRVSDMRVMPGRPGTLAIALNNNCCSPSHAGVAIYDDGVRRTRAPEYPGVNTLAFGESGSVLYGRNTEYAYEFHTMGVSDDGVVVVRSTGVGHDGFRLRYAAGRAYTEGTQVLDADRHEAVGSFTGSGGADMVPDVGLGRAFFITYDNRLAVYDLNTFQLIGGTSLGDLSASRRHLLRWGSGGLAFNDADSVYIVRTAIAGP